MKLCVSDKQEGFVVLDAESYCERADDAVDKNFKPIDTTKLKKAKQSSVALLAKEKLDSLCNTVKRTNRSCLQVLPGIPFRAIVSEL